MHYKCQLKLHLIHDPTRVNSLFYISNIVDVCSLWVINTDGNNLPVHLTLVNHSIHSYWLNLVHPTHGQLGAADFYNINWIVVALDKPMQRRTLELMPNWDDLKFLTRYLYTKLCVLVVFQALVLCKLNNALVLIGLN